MINCQLSIRYLLTDVYHAQSYDSAYLVFANNRPAATDRPLSFCQIENRKIM